MARWDDLAGISFEGNYPSDENRNRLRDEHWFQCAVQVYLGALPAVNMIRMGDGSEARFGAGYNVRSAVSPIDRPVPARPACEVRPGVRVR